jgi:hypothetical protein
LSTTAAVSQSRSYAWARRFSRPATAWVRQPLPAAPTRVGMFKHGRFTAGAIMNRRALSMLLRQARSTTGHLTPRDDTNAQT